MLALSLALAIAWILVAGRRFQSCGPKDQLSHPLDAAMAEQGRAD
jgi:hypothetical protein